jgi:protein bicaudal C
MNSLQELLQDIMTCSGTQIMLQMKTKSNSRLRNPLVSVIGTLEGIESAKDRLLSVFENMRQRVVLKMDVSFKDHSHIIGRGGLSIQQVMDETGSHIHFPDSNRISDVKKSNVVLVCGNPHGVEQARCRIRRLLPLIVHFQIPLQLLKKVSLAAHSKHLRSIQQVYNVHVSIRYSSDIDEQFAAIFDTGRGAKYVAVSVRGVNNDLGSLREALRVLLAYLTDFSLACALTYTLTIEITEYYHQLVMGSGCANIRAIMQRTGCVLTFPEVEPTSRHLDLDNLNEIPVNKSTVIVRGPSFEAVHAAWTELIGYLPLVLTFDLAHDQRLDTGLLNTLKKQHKVAIFLKHKEKFNTVIIRGVERHSKQLFEVRRQLLALDESEIPDCCELHATAGPSFDLLNGYASFASRNNEHLDRQRSSAFSLDGNNNSVAHLDSPNSLAVDKSIVPSLLANPELQSIFNPAVFQAVLKEQYLVLQQQQLQQQKQKHLQALGVNALPSVPPPPPPPTSMYTNGSSNALNSAPFSPQYNSLSQPPPPSSMSQHASSQLPPVHYRSSPPFSNSAQPLTSSQTFGSPNFESLSRNAVCDEVSRLLKHPFPSTSNDVVSSSAQPTLTTSVSSPALGQLATDSSGKSPNQTSAVSCMALNSLDSRYNSADSNSSNDHCELNNGANVGGNSNALVPITSSLTALTGSPTSATHSNAQQQSIWPDSKKLSYGECKYLALKATYEEPTANEVRVPSSIWSGFGFSKSMPPEALKSKLVEWNPSLDSPGSQNSNGSPMHKYLEQLNKPNGPSMLNHAALMDRQRLGRPLLRQESEICSNSTPYSSNYLNGLLNQNLSANQLRAIHSANFARPDQMPSSFGNANQLNSTMLNSVTSGPHTPTLKHQSSVHEPIASEHRSMNAAPDDSICSQLGAMFINVDNIDLSIVLVEFGLWIYIDVFKQWGINFSCFLRLSDEELFRMGIPFAGRRKLVAAITELRGLLQSNRIVSNFNVSTGAASAAMSDKMSRLPSASSLTNSSGVHSSVSADSPNASHSNESHELDLAGDSQTACEEHFAVTSGLSVGADEYLERMPSTPIKKVAFADDSTDEGLAGSSPIAASDKARESSLSNVLDSFVSPAAVQAN